MLQSAPVVLGEDDWWLMTPAMQRLYSEGMVHVTRRLDEYERGEPDWKVISTIVSDSGFGSILYPHNITVEFMEQWSAVNSVSYPLDAFAHMNVQLVLQSVRSQSLIITSSDYPKLVRRLRDHDLLSLVGRMMINAVEARSIDDSITGRAARLAELIADELEQ